MVRALCLVVGRDLRTEELSASATTIERYLDMMDVGEFKAEGLVQVVSRAQEEKELEKHATKPEFTFSTRGTWQRRSRLVRQMHPAAQKSSAPSCGSCPWRCSLPRLAFPLDSCCPTSTNVLGERFFRHPYDAEDSHMRSPSWRLVLKFEYHLRVRATDEVNKNGRTFAERFKLALCDTAHHVSHASSRGAAAFESTFEYPMPQACSSLATRSTPTMAHRPAPAALPMQSPARAGQRIPLGGRGAQGSRSLKLLAIFPRSLSQTSSDVRRSRFSDYWRLKAILMDVPTSVPL